ncbi:hypothetical protein OG749_36060 [Streptomyces nojiriensis]|uniref:hypothetical protein n=1 Tax=Streptomyces nojiriensis TaxID=66374 RepID=UPI002E179460
MPDVPLDTAVEIKLLRDTIHALHQQRDHVHQVFGGWDECAPCEKANEEADSTFACDAYKVWQRTFMAGITARAELAVGQLLAALAETQTQLANAERRVDELAAENESYEKALGLNEAAA